jgi:hypothetical protein
MSRSSLKLLALLFIATLWSGSALAGTTTLTLTRSTLINVTDGAGTTQHEAGSISRGATVLGEYFIERRVDTLPSPMFNTGAARITLFFKPKAGGTSTAPENVTIEGAHDFGSGGFKGSVSAASAPYNWIIGADAWYTAAGGTETLHVVWTASDALKLP